MKSASVTGVLDLEGIGIQLSLEELKRCVGTCRLTREGGEDGSGKDDFC